MAKSDKNAKKRPQRLLKQQKQKLRPWHGMLLLLLFALGSFLILALGIMPEQVSYTVGEIATENIFYERDTTTYVSTILTQQAQQAAAEQVEPVYTINETISDSLLDSLNANFNSIIQARNLAFEVDENGEVVEDYTEKLALLRDELPGTYTDEQLIYILNTSVAELTSMQQVLRNAVSGVYAQGVGDADDDLLAAKQAVQDSVSGSSISDEGKNFLDSFIDGIVWPANYLQSAVLTAVAVEEAIDAVPAVNVTVQRGQLLIARGSEITAEEIEALQALGLYSDAAGSLPYLGLAAIILSLYVLLGFYLSYYQKKVFEQLSKVALLGVIMLLVLLLCKLIAVIGQASDVESLSYINYLLPVSAASMLVAVLLGRNLAVFVTVILSVLAGLICDGTLSTTLVALGGGLAGIISTAHLNQRSQFVGASIYILLVNVILIGSWGVLNNYVYKEIGVAMLFGLTNGLFSAILAMGILPFLETAFGVTTEVRLLELSNSNHPLLKRLMVEAPGTYNHSILVGNLAEAAADAVGADPLIVRVAAYYHDIGKLKRPYFFIENQSAGDNPHDKLQPALSAMIITSHVRDGIEMLREQKFPEEIIDLVEQHHGNTVLRFFYHKAKEQALDKESVREEDYRYPFRRPQTKEAGLLHLADSVQAAVQAIRNPVKGQIEETIQNIIKGKMKDEQLSECPLTFQDLSLISQAFMTVLSGVNHSRIVYPDQVAKEVGGTIDARLLEHTKAALNSGANGANGTAAPTVAAGGAADHPDGQQLDAAAESGALPDRDQ